MKTIKRNSDDILIYNNEIRPYLLEKIFDAHSHLCLSEFHDYSLDNAGDDADTFFYNTDIVDLKNWWEALFPDSVVNGLIMGMPVYNCNLEEENDYIARNIDTDNDRFSLMTKPQMSVRYLENMIEQYHPVGLKPYLVFAEIENKQEARITDFINEEQLHIADRHELCVTLHVSKPRGMADKDNLEDIKRLIKQFPKVNFILAHCGRNFIAPNMAAALGELPAAENLWIDTSAVCDTGVFLELFSRYDISRILFGSDLVNAAAFRGSYIRLGMSWHAMTAQMISRKGGMPNRATFAVYENLSAMLRAARHCRLDDSAIHKIFYDNAAGLFRL